MFTRWFEKLYLEIIHHSRMNVGGFWDFCGVADTEQCMQFVFSGYSLKWRYGDAEEKNC